MWASGDDGMREGSTVYVVKLNRGGLFRNYMEPII